MDYSLARAQNFASNARRLGDNGTDVLSTLRQASLLLVQPAQRVCKTLAAVNPLQNIGKFAFRNKADCGDERNQTHSGGWR
jgi:hypothetical protein